MSLDACADLVARGDPDRYLTVLAAPLEARKRLLPIYAFNIEVSRAPWVSSEPLIAEMRLQWWRDVLAEIAAGGPVRRHDVAGALAAAIDPRDAHELDALVEARRWDIGREPFSDTGALLAHLDDSAGRLMWVAARALGACPEAEAPVRAAGRAAGLAAWLRAVPALVAAGRRPLSDTDAAAVTALAREGLEARAQALAARRRIATPIHPALWPGRLSGRVLRQAARGPDAVADGGLEPSEARRRGSLIWCRAFGRW